jgi:hypothetical protein
MLDTSLLSSIATQLMSDPAVDVEEHVAATGSKQLRSYFANRIPMSPHLGGAL